MSRKNNWQPETNAAQALGWIDERTKAVTPPVHPSSTFIRDPDNRYRTGYSYGRDTNPTYDQAEALLADLEGAEDAMLFASGLAAAAAIFQALKPGDRVITGDVMYWGVKAWFDEFGEPWGLKVDYVPAGDLDALAHAFADGPVQLVWLETPTNPLWSIWDIAAAADLCRRHGAILAVDNTVATPVLTRPLALGADIVMHSATKYLNGHSDIIAGALATREDSAFWQRVREARHISGGILGSFEAWLLLRGMRTLFLRVRESAATALKIARHFDGHPRIEQVLYPGLPHTPGHDVAARQMTGGFGAMLSIRVKGGEAAAVGAAARVRLWKRATSLGGVESLIEHRASVEGPDSPVPTDLLRLSCGIEAVEDLIADLEQALDN